METAMRIVPRSTESWEQFLRCLPEQHRTVTPAERTIFVADNDGVCAGVCVVEAGPYAVFYLLAVDPELDADDTATALRIIAKNGRAMLMHSGLLGMWMCPPEAAGVPLLESGADRNPVPMVWMNPNAPTMKPKASGAEPSKEEKAPTLKEVAAALPPRQKRQRRKKARRVSLAHG